MRKTLAERVTHQIGEEGPQLSAAEYAVRMDDILGDMTAGELLYRISDALEEMLEEMLNER